MPTFLLIIFLYYDYAPCNQAFLAKSCSSLSSLALSGTQASTGHTEAHYGSSWKPLHSVHLSVTI